MFRYLLVVVFTIGHLTPLAACPPSAAVCQVRQRVVKQAVVVQPVQAVQAVVSYGHAYNQQLVVKQVAVPQYWSVGSAIQEEAIARSVEKLIEARIQQGLEKALQNRQRDEQTGFTHPGTKLVQERCAVCHSTGSPKVNEGAPLLFSSLGDWQGTAEQADKAVDSVLSGRMPPPPKDGFNQTEFIVFQDYLKTILEGKQ